MNSHPTTSDNADLVSFHQASISDFNTQDEDEELTTPAEVLKEMTEVWNNECAAPKLLPHRFDLMECLVDQVEQMENNIAMHADTKQLKIAVHRMELHRIRYVVNHYLRTRLEKIEKNTIPILKEHEIRLQQRFELLDEKELALARKFAESRMKLFKTSFLGLIPESMQKLPVAVPKLSEHRVFIEVEKDGVEDINTRDMTDPNGEKVITLEKNTKHFLPFESIQHLLENRDVKLM